MKKFAFPFLCCCVVLNAAAQTFDPSQDGKYMTCTMITKSWEQRVALVLNQPAAILKKPASVLMLQSGEFVLKSDLEGFIINNNVWALRQTPLGDLWCVINKHGAIDQYTYVTSDGERDGSAVVTGQVTRNRFQPDLVTNSELMLGYKKKMASMVADYPELAAKVTAGEKGYGFTSMGNVIDEYNVWYEKNNPGKMKYLPGFDPNGPVKTVKTMEEVKAAQKAALELAYAGRTTTTSPEVASAKDNTPVKKETFAAKLARIKADGNKVGVVLDLKPVRSNPAERMMSSAMSTPVPVDGSFMDESLVAIGPEFLKELNTALNTTDLELIDLQKIPYRDVTIMGVPGRVDDWWATKYKIVFVLTVDPWIKTVNETFGGDVTFNATLNYFTYLVVTEYIGSPTSKEQDILGQVQNMGSFNMSYSQKEPNTDLHDNYDKLLAKVGMPLIDKARSGRADGVKKVQKKLVD